MSLSLLSFIHDDAYGSVCYQDYRNRPRNKHKRIFTSSAWWVQSYTRMNFRLILNQTQTRNFLAKLSLCNIVGTTILCYIMLSLYLTFSQITYSLVYCYHLSVLLMGQYWKEVNQEESYRDCPNTFLFYLVRLFGLLY